MNSCQRIAEMCKLFAEYEAIKESEFHFLILKMELVYLSLLKTQKIGYMIKEPIF